MQTQFIVYLSLIAMTLLVGLVTLKKLTSPFRILVLMMIYIFIVESINRTLVSLYGVNTNPIYHLNAIVLITFTAFIYVRLLELNPVSRRFIIITSFSCALLALLNTLFYQELKTFPSFSVAAHGFQSILLSLFTFNEMIKVPVRTSLVKQALFWMNTGTLVFYSFNFTGFVFFNEYIQFGESTSWLLYLNWIGNLLLYSTYLIALYLDQKTFHER